MQAAVGLSFAAYLLALVGVGFWMRRRPARFRDYVTGGGTIPAWLLCVSFFANFVSGNSFVGLAGESYSGGLVWLSLAVVVAASASVSWNWFGPRFARFARETGAETLPDLYAKKWSPGLARFVAAILVTGTLFYVLAVMRATALAVQGGLAIDYEEALIVIWVATVAYCIFGGLWADVSTDLIQGVVLLVGAVVLFAGLLLATGGEPARDAVDPTPVGAVLAVGLAMGLKLLADPKQVVVFYAFKDEASARRLRFWGPLPLFAVYLLLLPLGYLARNVLPVAPGGKLERIVPELATGGTVLPGWFSPIFIVALTAASMSSLDSALLVAGSCAEKHLAAPLFRRREPSLGWTRVLLFALSSVALALSFDPPGGILKMTKFASALVGASLLPSLVAGLASARVSTRAVAASVVLGSAGAVAGFVLSAPDRSPWIQDVFFSLALAILPIAVSAYLGRARGQSEPGPDPSTR